LKARTGVQHKSGRYNQPKAIVHFGAASPRNLISDEAALIGATRVETISNQIAGADEHVPSSRTDEGRLAAATYNPDHVQTESALRPASKDAATTDFATHPNHDNEPNPQDSPMTDLLSNKPIPTHERLIMALDLPTVDQAKALVDQLGDSVSFYKVGLELFMSGNYYELIHWLNIHNKHVFADLKFFDVPETVARAVRVLSQHGVDFATVHGNDAIMEAAGKAKGDLKVLAVTVLTSLDQGDMTDLGFDCDVQKLVLSRARRALALGCDGVISSGLEVPALRAEVDNKLLVVSPGIRPVENRPSDDQKRVVTVEQAFRNGADYIVVGRPIRDAADPRAAALAVQAQIRAVFGE